MHADGGKGGIGRFASETVTSERGWWFACRMRKIEAGVSAEQNDRWLIVRELRRAARNGAAIRVIEG